MVKRQQLYGGIMSGTSADGIDAVVVEAGDKPLLLAHHQEPYIPALRKSVFKAFGGKIELKELIRLNRDLGEAYAKAMIKACAKARIKSTKLAGVGCHGQTLWHLPPWGTLQAGEGAVVAARLGVPVVSDFRNADLAEGGQGAPIMPWAQKRLFAQPDRDVAVLNLGGIANLTFLPGGKGKVLAFDAGPGNMVMDALTREFWGQAFDKNGKRAATGGCSPKLLIWMLQHPYLKKAPPKSTGREDFGERFVRALLKRGEGVTLEDILATAAWFTADTVSQALNRWIRPRGRLSRVVVHGGGVNNSFLMYLLRRDLDGLDVVSCEDLGYPCQAVEPIGFALMAAETLAGKPSGIPSATGAARAAILGKISLPPAGRRH